MAWTQPDYGSAPTGEVITSLPVSGVEPLTKQVNVLRIEGVYQLPSPHGQAIQLWALNRSDGPQTILPGSRDRIEDGDADVGVTLAPGEDAVFWLLDSGMTAPPRVWWCSVMRAVKRKRGA